MSTAVEHGQGGPGVSRLTAIELRKSVDTRSGRWLLAVMCFLGCAALVLSSILGGDEASDIGAYITVGLAPLPLVLPIIGIMVMTSDWSQRSVHTTFALVPRRSRVLAAKVLSAVALVFAVAFSVVVSAVLIYVLQGLLTGRELVWSGSAQALRSFVGLSLFGALHGVAFGALLLSTPLAIAVILLVPLTLDLILGIWIGPAAVWFSSGTLPTWLSDANTASGAQALTSGVLWVGLPLALGWVRQLRREVR